MSWRTSRRVAGVAVGDARRARASVRAGSGSVPVSRATIAATSASSEDASGRRSWPAAVRASARGGAAGRAGRTPGPRGPGSAPRPRSATTRITGPTSGRTPAQPRADAALRVEAARPLGAGDHARPLDHRRHRLERRQRRRTRSAATGRAARGRGRSCAARSSGRTARSTVEIANSRTRVWPAKSTPSTVASNGPIVNRTCVPARVKTLTRTTEIAIGRVSRSEIRTSRRGDAGDGGRRQDRQADDRERAEIAAEHERADRFDGRDDRLGQRVEAVIRRSVSAGARRARKAASSAGASAPAWIAGSMGYALREADGLLALREARDESPAQGAAGSRRRRRR